MLGSVMKDCVLRLGPFSTSMLKKPASWGPEPASGSQARRKSRRKLREQTSSEAPRACAASRVVDVVALLEHLRDGQCHAHDLRIFGLASSSHGDLPLTSFLWHAL